MKNKSMMIPARLVELLPFLRRSDGARRFISQDAPLRSELFSAEQMEQHGRALAASHALGSRQGRDPLLPRLAKNEAVLIDACSLLTAAIKAERPITPAGEWLLDNFYLIEEQIRTARRHLPKRYSWELPRLAGGPSAGLPRVYDIALETISHGDGQVDPENLARFISAYQTITPLTLGELWAVPIMLRLALIENLRRVGARIADAGVGRNLANDWADQMTQVVERDPKSLILVVADMARSNPPTTSAFVAELTRRLQGQSPALALALTWVEQRLAEAGVTIAQLIQAESQHQAADQVSIANSIGSLRFLDVMDWRAFVETMSVADATLRNDPAGVYGVMDFATRDRYRHVLERIAKRSDLSEVDAARAAVELAQKAASRAGNDSRVAHVGFYLVAEGLAQILRRAGIRSTLQESIRRYRERHPLWMYLGPIALLTALVAGNLVSHAHEGGATGWLLGVCIALATLAASQLAVSLVNWLTTLLAEPSSMPRMDYRAGIPANARTLVVVPTLLVDAATVEALVEGLEVRFLANRDPHLHFGLLTDYVDAPEATLPSDAPLLDLAARRIAELNDEHGDDTFFLFHRPRRYNDRERTWMGFERKRGKLSDLNALLRGVGDDQFLRIVGQTDILGDVRYVITLDTDTQLPRDAARELVGAMMHPLNRPWYDVDQRRVVEGYGILQPRVAASLPGANRSLYARIQGGEAGLDPYTRSVSDVYQDLFGEGSFIGKGIYDIDVFEAALSNRFPDNRILSHDLLEGCYARSGLVTDVQVYEDDPATYIADMRRRHRWIRGDWQIASWLFSRVPGAAGQTERNPLPPVSQWKILDNLRRSLVAPSLTLLLLLGWTVLSPAGYWTLAVIGILAIPALAASFAELAAKSPDALWSQQLRAASIACGRRLVQTSFSIATLAFEAFMNLDAIVRTTVRIVITRRHLLQWAPASDDRGTTANLLASYGTMAVAPLFAVSATATIALVNPVALPVAAPILALWLASPLFAWWLSRPLVHRQPNLDATQRTFLRTIARRTWAFFEQVVGAEDHWLPPDNLQENPDVVVAHRTSPTNIGLSLLANLAAHDFGYISTGRLLARTADTFETLERLERYRGHFLNWYDTRTLAPLRPRYVSSVDSGNLAGHLFTLRSGLVALPDEPILHPRWLDGLVDTLSVLRTGDRRENESHEIVDRKLRSFVADPPRTLAAARVCLEGIAASVGQCARGPEANAQPEDRVWLDALGRQCRDALDELDSFAVWSAIPPDRLTAFAGLRTIPTLREIAAFDASLLPTIEAAIAAQATLVEREMLMTLADQIRYGCKRAIERIATIDRLAERVDALTNFEYEFLYDPARRLMAIGYNVSEQRCDAGYYDLLASEARLCTFIGIARGRLPQESWWSLGRLLTHAGGEPILLSWSGSMFEYLMPLLVMPTFANTLLDQTAKAAVARQIQYGSQRGVPWGISECGYNTVDAALNYQYRAFGVPGLGLQRGLSEDVVIAPYASALALMVAPRDACINLQQLAADGYVGRFGYYEAIDFTPSRVRRGETRAVVRSFMAHHEGMTLLALAHLLLDQPMQRRFAADPHFQATLLLLQERVPKARASYASNPELVDLRSTPDAPEAPVRVFTTPHTSVPAVQLLSNGRLHVMVTNAGGGFTRWNDIAVTRWREDGTCDAWGTFCYLRDPASGRVWSPAYLPARTPGDSFEASFSESRVEFRRRDEHFETHTEIVVSPEDDVELRRVRITNRAARQRWIEIVSYAEVVLTSAAADSLHPAFSNLFVQTEIVHARCAILCTRRARSRHEHGPGMLHLVAVHGATVADASYETDRARFIGRGFTVSDPQALRDAGPLSGTEGSVLDPIVAVKQRISLDAGQTVIADLVTGIGEDRAACLALIEKYQDRRLADRAFEMAWTHSHVVLRQLNITEADAQLYGRLTGSIVYANASLRADASVIARNRRSQSGLWGYAISGDLPIVLLQIKDSENIELVRELVQAHAYWRLKGLMVDLVIWNEERGGYRQLLHDQIMGLIAAGVEASLIDRPGGIFLRAADQISAEDRILLQSVARAIFTDRQGTLAEQVRRPSPREAAIASLIVPEELPEPAAPIRFERPELRLDNGLGGFSADGREYVIVTTETATTPAPWVNVLANPLFGCVVSESGPSYTWAENAHEYRLTPWHNDPVTDASGEAFYVRDEQTGRYWSPTPLPRRGEGPYVCRHGFGYSVFEHVEEGIHTELSIYVALDTELKFSVLRIRNVSARARRLSATGYVEWVLGDVRPKTTMHVVTEIDPGSGAVFARNAYHPEFAENVAFFDVDDVTRTISGDRTEFIGRNGTLRDPAAMARLRLSGKVGAAMDPCTAIRVPFELAPQQSREIIFRLGVGKGAEDANRLVMRHRKSGTARAALEAVKAYWKATLGAVEIATPEPSLDLLANGWLLYQTLACRLWGRSGYYQSGGAYGFRDQLQDTMALVHAQPQLMREHLLRCASRQFVEGDVQHWWHPPLGRGVRSHCSDDFLWLPLATCRYVTCTGDVGVLAERAPFLEGRQVGAEEESYYDMPIRSTEQASLYQHCVRAIERGLVFGERGLPLIGSGDWNDGMNNVGAHGRGESIWLGFFLYDVLTRFGKLADRQGDTAFAHRCSAEAQRLRENLERHGWDGHWYRRAYFDDGTPLGSASGPECRIDSVSQSWSVLSGAGDAARTRQAMNAVDRHLVRREHALIQLLDPPFDKAEWDPGYIRGYVPGVRENGGQYTHGAIWAAMAFAALHDAKRAWELFAMINPINHARSLDAVATYRAEPYVVAADVYAVDPHIGRGGWSWYTGSAGWMYRLILESLLGVSREDDRLRFAPCLPAHWPACEIRYRYGETLYRITLRQQSTPDAEPGVHVDGVSRPDRSVPLVDDRQEHVVDVVIDDMDQRRNVALSWSNAA
ncbi:MAG TPA: glucoamylase family protein [Casimicrobiaceae bacterium]|nr:glucoamylase family protein [Casimicrobiaceae bacterium]